MLKHSSYSKTSKQLRCKHWNKMVQVTKTSKFVRLKHLENKLKLKIQSWLHKIIEGKNLQALWKLNQEIKGRDNGFSTVHRLDAYPFSVFWDFKRLYAISFSKNIRLTKFLASWKFILIKNMSSICYGVCNLAETFHELFLPTHWGLKATVYLIK